MVRNIAFKAWLLGIVFLMSANAAAVTPEGVPTLILAEDKTRIYCSHVSAMNNNDKIVLLFHQAGSNRMEYEPVLDAIHINGFDTLTVDQRSGGDIWEFENATGLFTLLVQRTAAGWRVLHDHTSSDAP